MIINTLVFCAKVRDRLVMRGYRRNLEQPNSVLRAPHIDYTAALVSVRSAVQSNMVKHLYFQRHTNLNSVRRDQCG